MLLNALNIVYVLIAIAMLAFILLQRGAGATAGASFGAGASATVFGSRGASSFLTRTTAVLALSFFILSLGMGMYVSRGAGITQSVDLGVMGAETVETDVPAARTGTAAPASDVPAAPATRAPRAAPTPNAAKPAPTALAPPSASDVPKPDSPQTDVEPAR